MREQQQDDVVSAGAEGDGSTEQRNYGGDGHVNKAFTDGGENAAGIEPGAREQGDAAAHSSAVVGGIAHSSPAVDDDAEECGCCMMRPLCLRRFRTAKWVLFWLCWAGAAQGMVVNGFVNVAISTIERRFGLRSAATGLIAGGYDVASFVCLLPVSFLGGRVSASKPVWLAGGVLILGLGSLIFASPHFLSESPYSHLSGSHLLEDAKDNALCLYNNTISGLECLEPETRGGYTIKLSHWLWVFLIGQILHGVGASPLYTLGVTFIDESVSKKMSSVYLGIFYTTATIGPAVGYILGGQLLQIHADVGIIDVSVLGITPQSGLWVGAWWIGFILSAILCLIISLPLLAFPPSLPGAAALQAVKECEAHFGGNGESNIGGAAALSSGNIRGLPAAFCSLIANPTFFFLNLAGALEGLLISGFAAFLPKVIENQLGVDASKAAFFMGLVTVPAGGGATLLGGYLVKHFNLKCSGIIKLCVIATACGLIFTCGFFLSCSDAPLAGISLPYKSTINSQGIDSTQEFDVNWSAANFSLNHRCNAACGCTENDYNPICGADGLLYYSPCYAGCSSEKSVDGAIVYMGCECIVPNGQNLSISLPDGNTKVFGGDVYMAVNQLCKTTCNLLWPFMGLTFCVMFFTFLSTMPALSATLRCVESSQRSFALGIQWLTVRLVGTIPAPMIFGVVIDRTCLLWQETSSSCDDDITEEGACRHYDNFLMSRYMVALAFIGKAFALVFFYLAWRLYIPPPSGNGEEESADKSENEEIRNFPQYRKISEEQQEINYRNSQGRLGSFHLKTMNGHTNLNSEGFI